MDEKKELLRTTIEHLEYLHSMAQQAIKLLRTGEESQGTSKIIEFVDEISLSIEALEIIKDIQAEPIDASILNDLLATATEGLDSGDFVLVADILEYELLDLLTNWRESLSANL